MSLRIRIPAYLSHTGEEREAVKAIDRCIAPIVKALNECGIVTVYSCCGHGHRPGNIMLADGREIIIAKDYETAREVDRAFLAI